MSCNIAQAAASAAGSDSEQSTLDGYASADGDAGGDDRPTLWPLSRSRSRCNIAALRRSPFGSATAGWHGLQMPCSHMHWQCFSHVTDHSALQCCRARLCTMHRLPLGSSFGSQDGSVSVSPLQCRRLRSPTGHFKSAVPSLSAGAHPAAACVRHGAPGPAAARHAAGIATRVTAAPRYRTAGQQRAADRGPAAAPRPLAGGGAGGAAAGRR
jgi:hypothetical protein